MPLIDRYFLKELILPFLFSLVVFGCLMTTGFVLFNLIEESTHIHIPAPIFIQIILLRLPEMLFYTLPMAVLLASLLSISRLSADHELLVLRTTGMSFFRVLLPFMIFSLIAALLTIALNETLVPHSSFLARETLHFARTQKSLPQTRQHIIYRELEGQQLKKLFYAKTFDGQRMQDVTVQIFEDGQELILKAQTAGLRARQWIFQDGELLDLGKGKGEHHVLQFERYTLALPPAIFDIQKEIRQPLEMGVQELGNYIQQLKNAGQEAPALVVRWHQKIAIPFAAVVFALVGIPLGARTLRSTSLNLGLSLLVVFGYYTFMAIGSALGDTHQIPPWLGAWLPNMTGILAGLGLVIKRNYWG